MIEVLFGESEAALLKDSTSQSTGIPGITSTQTNDVICLAFMLDIGDISIPVASQYRQELIFSMYTQNESDNDPKLLEELKIAGKSYISELNRIMEYLEQGESIRIWYSNCPYSLCGLYYMCSMLVNYSSDVFTVRLPDYMETENETITSWSHWGELSTDEFHQFLGEQKKMTVTELQLLGERWTELTTDKSRLRALVNGSLIGVPDDFYDFLILKYLSDRPVKEALVIGNILLHYPLGIGDWWYASRINAMIETGIIEVSEDSGKKYERLIFRK